AEDGIRDFHVTGVQTCALPISSCAEEQATTSSPAAAQWRARSWPSCPAAPVIRTRTSAALLEGAPPPLVVAVPGDGGLEGLVEGVLLGPAERGDLRDVDRVPPVVPEPVLHVLHVRLVPAQQRQQLVHQHPVRGLVPRPDVVHLPRRP